MKIASELRNIISRLIYARNIANQNYLNSYLEDLIKEKQPNNNVKQWIESNLKKYLINKSDKAGLHQMDLSEYDPQEHEKWVKEALQNNEIVYEIASELRKIAHDINAEFWGKQGAGGLFYAASTGRVLVSHRSAYVNEPNTWGVFGGAIDANENPRDALRREIREETGYTGKFRLIPLKIFTATDFKYYNFLIVVPEEFEPKLDWETQATKWTSIDDLPSPLHFGLKYVLPDLKTKINELKAG